MRLILILIFPAFLYADACDDWFKKSNVASGTKECFYECSTIQASMGTFSCPQRCSELCKYSKHIRYFFGNGMFNTPMNAVDSANALQKSLIDELQKHPDLTALTKPVRVFVSYNVSEPLFHQLLQVFAQKAVSEEAKFFRWLADLNRAPDWFRKTAKELARLELEAFEVADEDFRIQYQTYQRILNKGDAIIVVSHSQGNLYSHAAFRKLYIDNGFTMDFRIIPIASPYHEEMSEKLHNGSPYTTLFSDGVILMVPGHYPPNVRNPNPGLFDHSFTKHYLAGANSGAKILNDVMCMTGVFLMRMRTLNINWYMLNDWDYKACEKMIPFPEKN